MMREGPSVVVIQPPALGFGPTRIICPYCYNLVWSIVLTEPNLMTHLTAALLCFICCPLACLPYCTPGCQSRNHYCPNCQAFLGRCQHSMY